MQSFFKSLYLSRRFFYIGGGVIGAYIFSYFYPLLLSWSHLGLTGFVLLIIKDLWDLYHPSKALTASRILSDRLSNGDMNAIRIDLAHNYQQDMQCEIIDEIPYQFQKRDFLVTKELKKSEGQSVVKESLKYSLRPVLRGEYTFGALNIFISTPLSLFKRLFVFDNDKTVSVYPSYIQMRKYELMAFSQNLTDYGLKRQRRLGHASEFEQIKEYVRGDDVRTINWKATARADKLMVNQFTEEKSQNVFCLIDKSRTMKMPFDGMTLLDYAINTTLVIANTAIHKQDKVGLISFAEKISTTVPPDNKPTHINNILEALYAQTTQFLEADYERLYVYIKRRIPQRSLLILYTNFESISALKRQMKYLKQISKHHLLLVVFFENTELKQLIQSRPNNTEDIYLQAIGENFASEKRQIVGELEQNGILTILTPPEQMTIKTLNKYLELKSRNQI